jgi:ATP-dependent DNA helicase UvrD/PcrA
VFGPSREEALDDAQLAAVCHGDGPLVVVAGAGTGKTRTLACRVAHLVEHGVAPERILLLTFTRRAAEEMLGRASVILGRPDLGARLRGGTFHAVAHGVVSAWAGVLGAREDFSVLDPGDAADVMELLRDEHGLSSKAERAPTAATLVDVYSRCLNTGQPLSQVLAADFPWCGAHGDAIAALCRAYVQHKRERAQLDFDDLLLYWRAALLDEHLGARLTAMFDHVLVDEYQDVNSLQVEIVHLMRPGGRGLTVVGDDAQAIYGFRGASAAHLGEAAAFFPGATVVRLERNFRSSQPVLDLANHVRRHTVAPPSSPIGRPAEAPEVHLVLRAARQGGVRPLLLRCHDAGTEARAVVDRILERHEPGRRLSEQAVLVRAGHHTDLIEVEMTARRVPYRKYGGLRFLEAAHVRDFLAAARLVHNRSDDVAWFRLLKLHQGIGTAQARRLLPNLSPVGPRPGMDWCEIAALAPPSAQPALKRTLAGLAAAREARGSAATVECLVSLMRPLVSSRYSDRGPRLSDLERMAAAAAAAPDLASWLAEMALGPPLSTSGLAGDPALDEDYVVVSTVHSAKGLEWPVVHLPHLVDGAFPSDMALRSEEGLREEGRLFYVALTRARDELLLYSPLRMPHHRFGTDDRHSFGQQSRWLDDQALAFLTVEEVGPGRQGKSAWFAGAAEDHEEGPLRPTVAAALSLESLWR